MIEALHLLQYLAAHLYPPSMRECYHAVQILPDGKLCVFVVEGGRWFKYALSDEDLTKDGYEIGAMIMKLHEEKRGIR